MKPTGRILGATLLMGAFAAAPAQADMIIDWNQKADAIATEKNVPAPQHTRGQAVLHVAMFEAVNAVDRRYAPYRLNLAAERSTSKEAAAASAAHAVLTALYPDQKSSLDATLASSLAGIADGEARAKGLDLGRRSAAGVLALRADDGADATEQYRPQTSSGVYIPTAMPVFSTYGAVRPWVMASGTQFLPPPPPTLDSDTWTEDLNEIRQLGARNASKRTAEQTDIGRFWILTGPRTYNPIVRQVVAAKEMDLVDCARLFALVALAGSDAHIAVFNAKYTYNLWRPVTAIRNADLTGNAETPREASWLPLGDTPMHPEYPCAHCISSAAVSAVLQAVVGNEVAEITMTSPTAPGVTRKWKRLKDYSDEVSEARIYAGFHYRFSTEAGKEMGRRIGELTVATQLRGMTAAAEPRP